MSNLLVVLLLGHAPLFRKQGLKCAQIYPTRGKLQRDQRAASAINQIQLTSRRSLGRSYTPLSLSLAPDCAQLEPIDALARTRPQFQPPLLDTTAPLLDSVYMRTRITLQYTSLYPCRVHLARHAPTPPPRQRQRRLPLQSGHRAGHFSRSPWATFPRPVSADTADRLPISTSG
jgi:hypothetical protein